MGVALGPSRWFEISLTRVSAFEASVSGPGSASPVGAGAGPRQTGGPATAPPFLVLSLVGAMSRDSVPAIEGSVVGLNYGFDRLCFSGDVLVGDRVRALFVLEAASEVSPGRWRLTYAVTIEVEGRPEPALYARWITLRVIGAMDMASRARAVEDT